MPAISLTPSQRRVLETGAIALLVVAVARYTVRHIGAAWDFETFYWAAAALSRGLDPYRTASLSAVAAKQVVLPFLYPPASLGPFVPFTWLPLHAAMMLWLGLKLALATALVALWRHAFLPGTSLPLLVVVAVLGFNAAMLWDLETGNVSVIEQLLLWLAFACFLHGRRMAFAVLVALASMFKLLPIAFLGLLWVPSKRPERRAGPALIGLGLFAAIVLLPSALGLSWAHGFPGRFPGQRPFGEVNPCALGLFDSLLGPGWWSGGKWSSGSGTRVTIGGRPDFALVLWGLYGASLLVSGRRVFARAWKERDPLKWVILASLVFALLSPRMMAYSYLLLVVPALLLVPVLFRRRFARAIAIGLVVLQGVQHYLRGALPVAFPIAPYPVSLALMHLPFLLALGLWVATLRAGGRRPAGPPAL